jgi:sortase A
VNAPIQNVGLAADGSMDVPKNPFDTGWYELGPRPGEIGSAVIAGHVNSPTGATAVFTNLDDLVIGDTIIVDNGKVTLSFRVREIRTYPADADATSVFMSTDGKAHLNLVTCSGSWNTKTDQYTERLVVFTDRN